MLELVSVKTADGQEYEPWASKNYINGVLGSMVLMSSGEYTPAIADLADTLDDLEQEHEPEEI